ncbi:RNA 3'-terminal phosphate cyclase/enolpyruvate transferase [Aspergillus desertorum]
MDEAQRSNPVRLDGRKLEGGGQLVRIAVALSALTGTARGLKASHLAAIRALGELSGSTLVKAQVGSCSGRSQQTNPEINIRLPTPGSVFLVFQALYPYLLIVGGTNVLIPNFARVGLPPISVRLEKRGWASGQGHLGKVIFAVDTLRRRRGGASNNENPSIDLHQCRRGEICKIDITVLAPDDHLVTDTAGTTDSGPPKHGSREDAAAVPVEKKKPETVPLRHRLKELPRDVFLRPPSGSTGLEGKPYLVPIETHTTEATHNRTCLYVLIVAHTSTRFKIGRDALTKRRQDKLWEEAKNRVEGLVDECVEHFIRELYDPVPQTQSSTTETPRHRPCVDEHMRHQLVIFKALGRAFGNGQQNLHTRTAQWVCQEMLGEGSPGDLGIQDG